MQLNSVISEFLVLFMLEFLPDNFMHLVFHKFPVSYLEQFLIEIIHFMHCGT